MNILVFGKGGRQEACRERLMSCSGSGGPDIKCAIVLPIPTTKDGKTVNGTEILLSELIDKIEEGTLVAGYGIPEECAREIEKRGAVIYDAIYDEQLLLKNAYLTALGAVSSILTSEQAGPEDIKIGIVGYGRIGKEIAKTWFFLGGAPRVYTKREEVSAELRSMGIASSVCDGTEDYRGLDILINTAPESIVSADSFGIGSVRRIIDLASGNYLKDLPRVEKMGQVPDKMYPKSAGKVYAEAIILRLGGVI
ncbi:MAG: hypothetical protein J6Q85_07635 [Clostridia bacterium]|nr:hypothetical protein [Clostridia bacterium]